MNWQRILSSLSLSNEKDLKMVWEVNNKGRNSFLIGTAHFSPYPYRKSLSRYIKKSAQVIFEGPLDEKSRQKIVEIGLQQNGGNILASLDKATIQKLQRLIADLFFPPHSLTFFPPWQFRKDQSLYEFFQNRRPWLAFFQIWAHFLKRQGWIYSLDLEAFQIASKLGKEIIFLETIEEQIASLEGIPLERISNFLKKIDLWPELARRHALLYAEGKIIDLLSSTREFPSRCPSIVEKRDPIMFARLQNIFAKGQAIAFLGTVHIPGIRERFQEEGYEVRQVGE